MLTSAPDIPNSIHLGRTLSGHSPFPKLLSQSYQGRALFVSWCRGFINSYIAYWFLTARFRTKFLEQRRVGLAHFLTYGDLLTILHQYLCWFHEQMHSSQPTILAIPDRHRVHQHMSPLPFVHKHHDQNLTFSDRIMANHESPFMHALWAHASMCMYLTDRVPPTTNCPNN